MGVSTTTVYPIGSSQPCPVSCRSASGTIVQFGAQHADAVVHAGNGAVGLRGRDLDGEVGLGRHHAAVSHGTGGAVATTVHVSSRSVARRTESPASFHGERPSVMVWCAGEHSSVGRCGLVRSCSRASPAGAGAADDVEVSLLVTVTTPKVVADQVQVKANQEEI